MIESNADNLRGDISPTAAPSTVAVDFENELRPLKLSEYIGQESVKKVLSVSIQATKKRDDVMDHVLLHGAPGLGKTTLAHIIASELGREIKITSGPALEKQGDLASILTNLSEGSVFFIDEIHRLKPAIEEVLYTAMEDFALDIVIGKGPSARSMRINLPQFTLIGATTKMSMISSPLRDRFGNLFKLQFYQDSEIEKILARSAGILECEIAPDALKRLATSARKTPRIANRLLKRARDFAIVQEEDQIVLPILEEALSAMGIDNFGLDETDRTILSLLIKRFGGGPVGLKTLSAASSEDKDTLEDIYEPFLIQLGMLERTPRGRVATARAYRHLGFEIG